ncbi:phosphotransferase family protein [Paenibacillus sp. R14(2021)]|uniref:phosphotransferase family protein n=1 Tax=Paenibacillus sp. R14(2021) TaxID=2859228 RepID=UPI001C615E16|nr:aminoglycoside phosphotransferase family protein [Paenibacillus sp. R14(2021)]
MKLAKPDITQAMVETVLNRHFGHPAQDVSEAAENGNFSKVYYFSAAGENYVILFTHVKDSDYDRMQFIADLLTSQGVPYARMVGRGAYGSHRYCILERIPGHVLVDCSPEQKAVMLEELAAMITKMNRVKLPETSTGYGPIMGNGNGEYESWSAYVQRFYAEDQRGTFWENWHELFTTTCLEREVFEECYRRLIAFLPCSAPQRHFVHNDCHQWNILSDGEQITGIIDSNGLYGDYLIDLTTIWDAFPGKGFIQAYRDYAVQIGSPIADFENRFAAAMYYKGLDCLRFYAKMGYTDAYRELRDRLLALPKEPEPQ